MNPNPSPADVAREWFQKVWNDRDEAAIERLLNASGDVHGLTPQDATRMTGPEQFKPFYQALTSAIPDFNITINRIIEEGDWVAVRFLCEGTHSGEGIGVPPSGNSVSFSGMCMGRIKDGQWVEGWNSVDFLTLNQQIGGSMAVG